MCLVRPTGESILLSNPSDVFISRKHSNCFPRILKQLKVLVSPGATNRADTSMDSWLPNVDWSTSSTQILSIELSLTKP